MIIIAASKAREVTSGYVDDNILVAAAATIAATAIVIIGRLPLHLHNTYWSGSEVAEKALVSFYSLLLSITFCHFLHFATSHTT